MWPGTPAGIRGLTTNNGTPPPPTDHHLRHTQSIYIQYITHGTDTKPLWIPSLFLSLSHTHMHRPAHMHTICSHTLLSKWQLVFSNSRTWPTICACAQIMHVFITCHCPSTLSRVLYLCVCMSHECVRVHVCAQPPKWNSAPERDWNQYFLLRHLSHLYKAETIWTPVYSTLASFIKLPHLAKADTHIDTHDLYKVPRTFCYKYRKHTSVCHRLLTGIMSS